MRRHTGTRHGRGARGLRLVNDVRRIRHYVGKHRQEVTRNTIKGLAIGAFLAAMVAIVLEMPHSTAILVVLFIAMALPGVALP